MVDAVPRHGARSISLPVAKLLAESKRGTVLATFARSAYLDLGRSIVAVVASELLNGPINVVLADPAPPFDRLAAGGAVTSMPGGLRLEGWPPIDARDAIRWDPRILRWSAGQLPKVTANLETLAGRVLAEVPADHLAHPRIERGLALLRSALGNRSPTELAAASSDLAGLGGGLTPTGDDVLVGVLVALAALPDRSGGELENAIRDGTAGRTTRISEAYLHAAARAEASEAWHRLLTALAGDRRDEVVAAGRRVLAFGETSGADMLTGFVLAMNTIAR
ncbi:MAG TPA: DUF2877 domain-containing protein [bacterium]|nr:DUF2877 domain-containing protein [bacterium]